MRPSLNSLISSLIIISLIISSATLAGCSNAAKNTKTTHDSKSSLQALAAKSSNKPSVSNIRSDMLRDTALSVGARGGLAHRAKQINKLLAGYDLWLARIFNFYGMLLDNNVLPPVLIEARNTLSLSGSDVIRIADRNYQILHQAKFVTSPPHWRDYLWMEYSSPETPDKVLLPSTKEEKLIWQKFVDQGWEAGLIQADVIFKENLHRLERDFNGMIRYRKLLAQNMVSPPFVATLDLGITGNESNLTVNDRVLRITAFPSLQISGDQWKTEIKQYE